MRNDSVTSNKEKIIASDDEEEPKDSESLSDQKKEAKEKFVAPLSGKKIIPKESIKTHKLTNAQNFINKSEPTASKEIIADNKIQSYFSFLYLGKGYSLTP